MKIITLISGGDVGGAKTHVLTLLRELNSEIRAELVCFMEGDFANEARALGIPTDVMASGNVLKDVSALKKRIADGGYDVIHCHGSKANFIGSLIKRSLNIPVITTVHSDPRLDYMGRPAGKLVYGTMNRHALKKMDYYVGVSDAMTDMLIDRGFPPEKIFTIYNGLEFPEETPAFDRAAYLEKLGISEECVVAGIAARLNPVKDIATLIRGFARAAGECDKLRLLIAGDGEEREMLENLAKELGVFDKIRFLGWVSETGDFYRALDINTLTSVSETFPYALTEGAREWLPTVSSRVGGVPYLISDGVNGCLFEPGDFETLGDKLAALAKAPALRKRLGESLGRKAREHYSLRATRDTQLKIYEAVKRRKAREGDKRRDGVAICGAYGRGNMGDNAILEAIIGDMREIDPDMPLTVLSKDPAETRKKYRVSSIFIFNILKYLRTVGRTKLYINGGGSLIQDVTSRRSLLFYLFNIYAAKKRGNKVLMYGCGIGPVLNEADRKLAGRVLNRYVDVISLREKNSLEELRLLGVTKPEIIISADPALTLRPAGDENIDSVMMAAGLEPRGAYFCFSLRFWRGFSDKLQDFAEAAEYVYNKYNMTPVFVPIDYAGDLVAEEKVAECLSVPYCIIKKPMTSGEYIGVMSRMTAVLSMRLHGLIFAAQSGAPLIGVAYDPKVTSFMQYLGQELCCRLEETNGETLRKMIDGAAALAPERERLREDAARLARAEALNTQTARRLLEK